MSAKITRPMLHKDYACVVSCSYAVLHSLCEIAGTKIGHNEGECGWNWSAYEFADDVVLNTGYRNMTGVHLRTEDVKSFELKANDIKRRAPYAYETCKEQLRESFAEFCRKAYENA